MGYLYKRKKTWYLGYRDHAGRWVQKSARTQFKPAALEALRAAEIQAAKGERPSGPIPLADFLSSHLAAQRPSLQSKTHARYQHCMSNLTAHDSPLAGSRLSELTVGLCSEYAYWRSSRGATAGTIEKELGWLKAALTEAARRGAISWERVAHIRDELTRRRCGPLRKAGAKRERVLLPHEVPILFAQLASNPNLHDAAQLALWTGVRQGNILSVKEGQADFSTEPAVLRLEQRAMKNRRALIVYLSPAIKDLLWARWQGIPTRPFFFDFRPAWKRNQKRLAKALPDFRWHDLRRTYITYRLAAGIDPKTVQAEVGHQDSRMTMDCYAISLRDPAIRSWAMQHFRFPYDPPLNPVSYMQEKLENRVETHDRR